MMIPKIGHNVNTLQILIPTLTIPPVLAIAFAYANISFSA